LIREAPGELLLLGKVLRPHGTAGLLRVQSYARSAASFKEAGSVWLRSPTGEIQEFPLKWVKPHKRFLLMALKGLTTGDAAEAYRDADVLVRREAVGRGEDEYFWYELLGLRVFLEDGAYLGRVSQIIPTGGCDIYVVREGEREYLIPATEDVVKGIDRAAKTMTISPLEGLLEL